MLGVCHEESVSCICRLLQLVQLQQDKKELVDTSGLGSDGMTKENLNVEFMDNG